MTTFKFFGLAILFVGALTNGVPDEKVKAAFIHGLRQIHASPRLIESYEKHWDGSLPETLGDTKPTFRQVGLTEEEIQTLLDSLATVAKNRDNPSWKTHYGNLFITLHGGDKSLVEKLEQTAPDTIPKDINEAKEALKKAGVDEEHAQGCAKIAVWLGRVHY